MIFVKKRRKKIQSGDNSVFLISKESMEAGSFPLDCKLL